MPWIISARRFIAPAIALALTVAVGAGCRVDAQQCDQACRNVASLLYWKTADRDIAAAPADQRDALRQQKLSEFATKVESGIDGCILQCQSARDQAGVDCMIAARTADAVLACSR